MATERYSLPGIASEIGLLSWAIIGVIFLSLLVIPGVVLWVGTQGGHSSLDISIRMFGIIAMAPGVLLGAASLLVMLGSE